MRKEGNSIYIIPGLGESTRAQNYREIINYLKSENNKVIPIKVTWGREMKMGDFITQVDKQLPDEIPNGYILGFSFGAYIAAVLSSKKKVDGYIFCSTSPYFKEDLKYIPRESREYFGEKMFTSFKEYTFPTQSKVRAWFLVGEKDWPLAIKRAQEAFKKWRGPKKLIIVKNAGHQLSHPNYINEVKKILKKL